MKLSGMFALCAALAFAACKRPIADGTADASRPPAAATPPPGPELASEGVFYLLTAVRMETASGIQGLPPGTGVKLVRPGVYQTPIGEMKLSAANLTNDLRKARAARAADQASQAAAQKRLAADAEEAARQEQARAKAAQRTAMEAYAASAATPAKRPARPSVPLGQGTALDRGAYGRTNTFKDTDGDGRAFDLRQVDKSQKK